ncbi:unnamed protein product [Clavelina lepadiformis]|uniref:Uncharacterized protein n=1 Tax=Clavelina lepadiformis TaxID=159417 RepID=A0ABP0GLJ7_CLALP
MLTTKIFQSETRFLKARWGYKLLHKSMSSREKRQLYAVKPEIQKIMQQEAKPIAPKKTWFKSYSSIVTFIFSMVVWTICGVYAYEVHQNKIKNQTDDSIEPEQADVTEEEQKTFPNLIKPKSLKNRGIILGSKGWEDYRDKHKPTNVFNNPFVLINEEDEKVEMVQRVFSQLTMISEIPFHRIERDEEGNLMFDKDGYPIQKPHRFIELVNYLRESITSFIFD